MPGALSPSPDLIGPRRKGGGRPQAEARSQAGPGFSRWHLAGEGAGAWPGSKGGGGVSRVRTSGGDCLGAAGRAGQFEKRVGVCRVGAGGASCALARRIASRGRRRELRRRWRGRVASGATSAARGRRRQPSVLVPQPEEASPELAVDPGCASRSGRLSPPRCCPVFSPGPGVGPRPGGKSGWKGRGRRLGFFSSSLLPFSVSSSAPHRLILWAWLLGVGPFGGTERGRGRGETMLGAGGGSLARLPPLTGLFLLGGLRLRPFLEASA